jgi:hypothetical protein
MFTIFSVFHTKRTVDRQNWTSRMGQVEQDRQNRTGRKEKEELDRQKVAEQDRRKRKERTE